MRNREYRITQSFLSLYPLTANVLEADPPEVNKILLSSA